MKKVLMIIMFLGIFLPSYSASPYRDEPAFKSGEKAVYNIYYNLGFIWVHAGSAEFSVEKKKDKGKSYYHLQLTGNTRRSFDKFYRIRDTFSVMVSEEDLMPHYYREVKNEDSFFADFRYYFNYSGTPQVRLDFNRRGVKSVDTMNIGKDVFDLLTTCYRFRSLDVGKVEKGSYLPFNMLFDKSVYNLGLTYKGKEEIKLRNKKSYKALKFTPRLITGDLFKKEDAMSIYVSDDDNHVPLYIEAKIKVGAVKVMLESVKNTKYPFSAQLEK